MKKALLISCFDWYKPRLEPIREILIQRGYEVTTLIADYDHMRKQPLKKKHRECVYIKVPQYKKNLSFQRIRSHLSFGKAVAERLRIIKPDLIYLLVPPNNTAKYCNQYKRSNPNTKLLLDIIDLWPESMPLGKIRNTFPAKIWRKWRDDGIEVADHVFTECELYQNKLNLDKTKTSTLYLFKEQTKEERDLVEEIIKKRQTGENIIKFAYLGSINNIIDIVGICSVIKQFISNGYECEMHAVGDGEAREEFETAIKGTGCKTFFYGSVFDEVDKIRILAPCDYAFNMMKSDISVGLTIKSIDYFSYGLPLINNIKGDTWRLVEKEEIGINIPENNSIIDNKRLDHYQVLSFFVEQFTKTSFERNILDMIKNI